MRQYIGARYVPKFYENSQGGTEWESGFAYEPLTIVTYNGNSFTSKKTVPATVGAPNLNPEYWASTGIYNQQVEEYRQEVEALSATVADDKAELEENIAETKEELTADVAETNKRVSKRNYTFNGEKVIGHAGASGLAPANTMAGFLLAAMLKADAIESDVQITSDGVLVCFHNDTVNGHVIRETESSVILAQTVTGSYSTRFAEQTIPTYEEFVHVCKNAGVECITEIKWEGQHITVSELPIILQVLERNDMLENTVFISWYTEPLIALLQLNPNLKCMPLYGLYEAVTETDIRWCAENGMYGIGMARSTNPNMILTAHNMGLRTNVFTLGKNDSVINSFVYAECDYMTSEYIIDVGARNNPYTSTSPTRRTAVFGRYGQGLMHKFFENCPPEFPTFNTTTSRFSEVEAEKRMPARISEINTTYAQVVINVASGETVHVNIPDGYRCSILFYRASGEYVSGTTWITTAGLHDETVPANAGVAVVSYQHGEGEALDYWNLMDVGWTTSVS